MRDQVWKIEDFLSKWEAAAAAGAPGTPSGGAVGAGGKGPAAADGAEAAIGSILLQEIDSYRWVAGGVIYYSYIGCVIHIPSWSVCQPDAGWFGICSGANCLTSRPSQPPHGPA
jgi:hypothetical protein